MSDYIDVEAITSSFPEGLFIAKVNDDSFDEDMFEHLYGTEDHDNWKQLLVGNSCAGSYVSDGQVVFVTPNGDIEWTQETAVKLAEDVSIIHMPGEPCQTFSLARTRRIAP